MRQAPLRVPALSQCVLNPPCLDRLNEVELRDRSPGLRLERDDLNFEPYLYLAGWPGFGVERLMNCRMSSFAFFKSSARKYIICPLR